MSGSAQKSAVVIALIIILSFVTSAYSATKVCLLAGQSNMVGWADNSELPSELQQLRPDIQTCWQYDWQDLQPGLGGNSSKFGPEITFGPDVADVQPGEDIVLVKYAVSGTSLWNHWRAADGVEYINFMDVVGDALLSISEPDIIAMVWMQGESDAYSLHSTLQYAEDYEQNLTDFIQHIRADFGVPDLPFVIGQISQSPVWQWGDIVRQAQLSVSQTVPNTALVVTDDLALQADGMHYDANGTMALGSRFADAVKNLAFSSDGACSSTEGAAISWLYAITEGDSRVLVVSACGEDDDPCDLVINSVKYDNIDMNEVPGSRQSVFADGSYVTVQLFYLPEADLPDAGDCRVEINFSGSVNKRCGGAVLLSGVEQQSPIAVVTGLIEDSNSISTEIIIQTEGAWVVDAVGSSSAEVFVADGSQREKFNISGDNITMAGSTKPVVAAGQTTINWGLGDGTYAIVHSVAAFGTPINTISGQVIGSDDTPIEGVAVAADVGGAGDTTDANGSYEISVVRSWSGNIKQVKDGFLFGPSERQYSAVAADVSGQDYKELSVYDLDTDGLIGWGDMRVLSEHWLETGENIPGDFYKDEANIVDLLDFAVFAKVWGE